MTPLDSRWTPTGIRGGQERPLQEGNGGGDAEHIEHAQTDIFDVFGVSGWVFEGGHKVEEAPNMKTSPDGLVFVFGTGRWGGAGAWVDGWERCRTCLPGHVLHF